MILEVVNLHKYYQAGDFKLHVLKGISLRISRGEFLAIRGPSGAGKSTLLHIIGGLERPEEGKVLLNGEDIYYLNDDELSSLRNKNMGFVFQFYHLIPELTILENVALPLLIQGKDKSQAFNMAGELLSFFKMENRARHYPNQVSGGEQQRAAIARAIITEPQLLLCDEPTGNLDSQIGKEVLKLLQDINRKKGTTIIIVTHDSEVARWAKREFYIKDGILSEKGGSV
ncbi:MAG: ABC transporter ATP-binding protein [Candidatus Omnitrophica bacterium 4484_49]|nr:ABC transporter ATP-binding protein [Candidatus Omnitrophota bacterium]OQX83865.1 MAG: ABC transporter ATP-binding protein [Candidatus Omnitrophica bacterium 4484_49]